MGLSLGNKELKPEPSNVDVINNINMYDPQYDNMADHIHIGPQGPLLEKVQRVNQNYGLNVGFTRTFRWSPGYKKQIAQRLIEYGGWDKPTCAPHRLFEKYTDSMYRVNNLKDQIMELNNDLYILRNQGMVWLEDPTVIFDKLTIIKEKIAQEMLFISKFKTLPMKVYVDIAAATDNDIPGAHYSYIMQSEYDEIMSQDGEITDYTDFYHLFKAHYISITLEISDFPINMMNIEGETLARVPGSELVLQFLISMPRLLNQLQIKDLHQINPTYNRGYYYNGRHSAFVHARGFYNSEYGFYHPYINRRYDRQGEGWSGVCLGDLTTAMHDNAGRLELGALVLQFHQWATTYTVGHTNPLNQPNYLHFGMPEEFGEGYRNSIGQDPQGCYSRLYTAISKKEDIPEDDRGKACVAVCNTIKCSLRDSCAQYISLNDTIDEEENMSDDDKEMIKQMKNWANTAQRGGLNG